MAEATIANEDADLAAVARGMLKDPYWALHAIQAVSKDAHLRSRTKLLIDESCRARIASAAGLTVADAANKIS